MHLTTNNHWFIWTDNNHDLWYHIVGLAQERHKSCTLAMELRLSCTIPNDMVWLGHSGLTQSVSLMQWSVHDLGQHWMLPDGTKPLPDYLMHIVNILRRTSQYTLCLWKYSWRSYLLNVSFPWAEWVNHPYRPLVWATWPGHNHKPYCLDATDD